MHTNRLLHEKSPYLLQHAHNPVDWFPWGDEAFAKAKREEKPIFLSIGYSTCHWCHVMERESFENEAVAAYLNEHFVAIKVDREERPDVDAYYMNAVQAMSGSGGWPMSVFLATDLQPFFAGTYFPPKQAYGRPSFMGLLERIHELWGTRRDELVQSGNGFVDSMKAIAETPEQAAELTEEVFDVGYQFFRRSYDAAEGGFGGAPKFPRPSVLNFLFTYSAVRKDENARNMALNTLRKMAMGGMHDHLGGGFHRYSVDKYWRVSHFEKMLYDQAQLVDSYLDAWVVTKDSFFADAARDTIEYVLRDMTHADGGFFSAEDADSEGEEGTFYVWTMDDLRGALEDDAELVAFYYGMTAEGNFEHGKSVLHVSRTPEETAAKFESDPEMIAERLSAAREILFALRETRPRPLRDDKILTSWNGLMIGAMARAGRVLGEERYLGSASRAAQFILRELCPEGTLLHRWRDGDAKYNAYLDDYAFFVKGLLDLYEATFDGRWIAEAARLQEQQQEQLADDINGGYFMSRPSPDLLSRSRGDYDGAEPNGNSVSLRNLLRLSALTREDQFGVWATRTLAGFSTRVKDHPYAMPEMLAAASAAVFGSVEIVLAGESRSAEFEAMVAERWKHLVPRSVTMSAATAPSAVDKIANVATAYVCRNFVCELPVTSVDVFAKQLAEASVG